MAEVVQALTNLSTLLLGYVGWMSGVRWLSPLRCVAIDEWLLRPNHPAAETTDSAIKSFTAAMRGERLAAARSAVQERPG